MNYFLAGLCTQAAINQLVIGNHGFAALGFVIAALNVVAARRSA